MTDLDVRTDVYSLAAVVYEMLVGEVPGRWPTEDAVRAGRFLEAPAAHRTRLAAAGPGIEGALVRGLAIRQEQRTASPEALMAELAAGAAPRRKFRSDEAVEIVKRAAALEATQPDPDRRHDDGRRRGARRRGGDRPGAGPLGGAGHRPADPATGTLTAETKYSRVAGGPTRLYLRTGRRRRAARGRIPLRRRGDPAGDGKRGSGEPAGPFLQLGLQEQRSYAATSRSASRCAPAAPVSRWSRIFRQLLGAVFGGIGGGMGGGGFGLLGGIIGGALNAPVALLLAMPAWIVLTYGVARTTYSRSSRRRDHELQAFADHLEAVIAEEVGPTPRLPAGR